MTSFWNCWGKRLLRELRITPLIIRTLVLVVLDCLSCKEMLLLGFHCNNFNLSFVFEVFKFSASLRPNLVYCFRQCTCNKTGRYTNYIDNLANIKMTPKIVEEVKRM